jgi:DNA-binding Lrp family transcriptional regulator
MAASSNTTLSLSILSTIEKYGKIPREFLYEKLSASRSDIDNRLRELEERGAVKSTDDLLTTKSKT